MADLRPEQLDEMLLMDQLEGADSGTKPDGTPDLSSPYDMQGFDLAVPSTPLEPPTPTPSPYAEATKLSSPVPNEGMFENFDTVDPRPLKELAKSAALESLTDSDIEGILGPRPGVLGDIGFILSGGMLSGKSRLGYTKQKANLINSREYTRNQQALSSDRLMNALEKAYVTSDSKLKGDVYKADSGLQGRVVTAQGFLGAQTMRSADAAARNANLLRIATNKTATDEQRSLARNLLLKDLAEQDAELKREQMDSDEFIAQGRDATSLATNAATNKSRETALQTVASAKSVVQNARALGDDEFQAAFGTTRAALSAMTAMAAAGDTTAQSELSIFTARGLKYYGNKNASINTGKPGESIAPDALRQVFEHFKSQQRR